MIRRVYMIRLDAKTSRPWEGREFVIEDLPEWTMEHRGELLWALLTLVRSWLIADRPCPDVSPLGGFEKWTTTVGGILEHVGVCGFLANQSEMYSTVDHEEAEWAELLEAIYRYQGRDPTSGEHEEQRCVAFFAQDLAKKLEDAYQKRSRAELDPEIQVILNATPDKVLEALTHGRSVSRTLGKMFSHRRDQRFGRRGWHITPSGEINRAKLWQVVCSSEYTEFDEFDMPRSEPQATPSSG